MESNTLVLGGLSGMTAQAIVWPLEFMKTVKQLSTRPQSLASRNFNALGQIINYRRSHGLWAIYRGMFPPVLFAFPRAALRFQIFDHLSKKAERPLSATETLSAGVFTGCTEAVLLMTPAEMLKTYSIERNIPIHQSVKEIYHSSRGLRGLWNGGSATLMKQGITQGVTFLTVDRARYYLDNHLPFFQPFSIFLGGLLGGAVAVLINNPLDVVKTRQQRTVHESSSVFSMGTEILQQEGIRGLYRGAALRAVRMGLLQAFTFYIYHSLTPTNS